jgi:hypothetical protein
VSTATGCSWISSASALCRGGRPLHPHYGASHALIPESLARMDTECTRAKHRLRSAVASLWCDARFRDDDDSTVPRFAPVPPPVFLQHPDDREPCAHTCQPRVQLPERTGGASRAPGPQLGDVRRRSVWSPSAVHVCHNQIPGRLRARADRRGRKAIAFAVRRTFMSAPIGSRTSLLAPRCLAAANHAPSMDLRPMPLTRPPPGGAGAHISLSGKF